VILLTDGYIGFEQEVIGAIMQRLEAGCRVHAVGVGPAPNRSLTRGVARAGRGEELFVTDGMDASSSADQLLRATVAPVLTDLSIIGSACLGVAPQRPRDVLAGQPLVAAVELKPAGGTIEVRGRLAGSRADWIQTLDVSKPPMISTLPIGAMFGREAVEDKEVALAANEYDHSEIESAIETLGMRHRITTRRTSLVAISDEPAVDPTKPRRRRRLEVELPAGVSAEGVGLATSDLAKRICALPAPHTDSCLDLDQMRSVSRGIDRADDEEMRSLIELREVRAESALPRPPAAARPRTAKARVVRIVGDLLVVEFESPSDGFTLPQAGEEVEVRLDDGTELLAMIDGDVSTGPGPHDKGLTLRLGLRHAGGAPWPKAPVSIWWSLPDGDRIFIDTSSGEQA
jgi:hypothetical protein